MTNFFKTPPSSPTRQSSIHNIDDAIFLTEKTQLETQIAILKKKINAFSITNGAQPSDLLAELAVLTSNLNKLNEENGNKLTDDDNSDEYKVGGKSRRKRRTKRRNSMRKKKKPKRTKKNKKSKKKRKRSATKRRK
jgi:hypothetical protein